MLKYLRLYARLLCICISDYDSNENATGYSFTQNKNLLVVRRLSILHLYFYITRVCRQT